MGRITESKIRESDKVKADAALLKSSQRNPDLRIPSKVDDFFTRETIYLSWDDSLCSISKSRSYHHWSFGSWDTKPTTDDLVKVLGFLWSEADKRWGKKPLFAVINKNCPCVKEFSREGKLVRELVDSVNEISPGSATVLEKPVSMNLPVINEKGKEIGLVYFDQVFGHTLPLTHVDA